MNKIVNINTADANLNSFSSANSFIASVENIPGMHSACAFMQRSFDVFRLRRRISPITLPGGRGQFIPWGEDNLLPYRILSMIEEDETMSACLEFQTEVLYGAGLLLDSQEASAAVAGQADEFYTDNDLPSLWMGLAMDLKYYAFAVVELSLSADASRIAAIRRLEACYCRLAPQDKDGSIPEVHYADWTLASLDPSEVASIPLLDRSRPARDLAARINKGTKCRSFAMMVALPRIDSTYYPIPTYASLFKGRWYDIKRLIAVAKEAKLRNSAPIKYLIQISDKYFPRLLQREGITDPAKQKLRVIEEKRRMMEFLTGAHNSGKAWFTTSYMTPDGKIQSDVSITKIESDKEGGDWQTDIQEAINMVCFAMRVHSNLVGSVPGKAQSNNSGSDKRELYTIAQALQKPYRDMLFAIFRLIIGFNCWDGVRPVCPFIQLTTLDKHSDAVQSQI